MKTTWYARNREKALAQAKAWREANPERFRENVKRWKAENREKDRLHRKKAQWKMNGIILTPTEYDVMWSAQGGKCKICGKEQKTRKLAVDHDHETGAIRGLLCTGCNISLGHIEAYKANPARFDQYLMNEPVIPAKPAAGAWEPPPEGYDPKLQAMMDLL